MGVDVGTVLSLAHFPVKSTAGESLRAAHVNVRGLAHDRSWAVYTADGGIASGKTTRRFRKVPGLLRWRSSMPTGGDLPGTGPTLHSPDGRVYSVDDPEAAAALSRALGQPVTLRPETSVRHHDESGVHLVSTSSLRAAAGLAGGEIDARRCRANLILATHGLGFLEDDWTGAELAVGPEVVLGLGPGMPRCVMVDEPQADVATGPPLLKVLGARHRLVLGLQAQVIRPGTVAVGDTARLVSGGTGA